MTRVDFVKLTSKRHLRYLAFTFLTLIAVAVVVTLRSPEYRSSLPLLGLLLGWAVVWWVRDKQWLETTADDDVLVQRRLVSTRRVSLRRARHASLRTNGAGAVQLVVVDEDTDAFVSLLMVGMYVERSQPGPVLRELAVVLDRSRAKGGGELAEQVREQAAHEEAGGDPASSPLAPMAMDLTGRIARGG